MIKDESRSNVSSIRRLVRELQRQLADEEGVFTFTIRGGQGNANPQDDVTAIASENAMTSHDYDTVNKYFNDWTAAGCDCTQPARTVDGEGDWRTECTCSSEQE